MWHRWGAIHELVTVPISEAVHTDAHVDIHTDVHTDIHVDVHADVHADIHADVHSDVHIDDKDIDVREPTVDTVMENNFFDNVPAMNRGSEMLIGINVPTVNPCQQLDNKHIHAKKLTI